MALPCVDSSSYCLRYNKDTRIEGQTDPDGMPDMVAALCVARTTDNGSLELVVLLERKGRKGQVTVRSLTRDSDAPHAAETS